MRFLLFEKHMIVERGLRAASVLKWGSRAAALNAVPPGRHPEGLARMASIHQKGSRTVRIAIQLMERRPVVSHSRNSAARRTRF
jgi:hypothetical protein